MAYDYFTIRGLAGEMAALVGGEVASVDEVDESLFVSVAPSPGRSASTTLINRFDFEALYLGEASACDAAIGATGVSDGERYLRGASVVAVEADRRERQIAVRLSRRGADGAESFGRLIFELVHKRFQTILMADRSQRVIWVWSRSGTEKGRANRRVRVGQPYTPAPNTRLLPGEDDASAFISRMREENRTEVLVRAATRHLCGTDRHIAVELTNRADISSAQMIGECSDGELERFWSEGEEMFAGCDSPASTWVEAGKTQFSALTPARQVSELVNHSTVSDGIAHWLRAVEDAAAVSSKVRSGNHSAGRRGLKPLRTRLRALERKLRALQQDLSETSDAEELARKGAIVLAHAADIDPGARQVELPDSFDADGNSRILIELDPQRSAAEVGGSYLKRAAKLRKRSQVLPPRLARLEREIEQMRQLVSDCERGSISEDEIDDLIRELSPVDHTSSRHKEPQARPRRYRTSAGWIVWAGRNNRENDVLTHRLAAPEDIWFHAHGYAGSHVVLRRDGRKEQPSARTLEEAAAVAAYWSKGRTANKVSVSYTAAKHVRKPRGAAPGLAVMSREKTILVRPMLLPEEDASLSQDQ